MSRQKHFQKTVALINQIIKQEYTESYWCFTLLTTVVNLDDT
jgi:hypothetical protein